MNEILLNIDSEKYTIKDMVTILEVLTNKIDIDTISGMARKESKSPNGIKTSNRYRKIRIGSQLMCIKGVSESNLPF